MVLHVLLARAIPWPRYSHSAVAAGLMTPRALAQLGTTGMASLADACRAAHATTMPLHCPARARLVRCVILSSACAIQASLVVG